MTERPFSELSLILAWLRDTGLWYVVRQWWKVRRYDDASILRLRRMESDARERLCVPVAAAEGGEG